MGADGSDQPIEIEWLLEVFMRLETIGTNPAVMRSSHTDHGHVAVAGIRELAMLVAGSVQLLGRRAPTGVLLAAGMAAITGGFMLLVLILGYLAIRPWHLRWGATEEEVSRAMPGDLEHIGWTRAITIDARPAEIWPWLVQWGQGRGGWYSYDWLENLFGFDIHTADRILPEYQNLKIGDPICMSRSFCPSHVITLEPNRWLSWQAEDENGDPVWTFTFGLSPVDDSHTRLIVRESFDNSFMPPVAVFVLEIPDVVMELKSLNTVKARAEGVAPSIFTMPLEIVTWLTVLVVGLIAVTRRILVLTAELPHLIKEDGELFYNSMIELALLTILIVALVISISFIRPRNPNAAAEETALIKK